MHTNTQRHKSDVVSYSQFSVWKSGTNCSSLSGTWAKDTSREEEREWLFLMLMDNAALITALYSPIPSSWDSRLAYPSIVCLCCRLKNTAAENMFYRKSGQGVLFFFLAPMFSLFKKKKSTIRFYMLQQPLGRDRIIFIWWSNLCLLLNPRSLIFVKVKNTIMLFPFRKKKSL